MITESTSPPAAWVVADVIAWATQARLAPDAVSSLTLNEVDGPTLVTLTKSELQSELGIVSLPARRYVLVGAYQKSQGRTSNLRLFSCHRSP